MKLRNKKTGEISEFNEIYLTKTVKETNTATSEYVERAFYSISDLQDEFEDYKPAEPLIKDEKIRKAVRAWAESLGVDKVFVEKPSFEHNRFILSVSGYYEIGFDIDIPENIKPCKSYAIAELCGEGEE